MLSSWDQNNFLTVTFSCSWSRTSKLSISIAIETTLILTAGEFLTLVFFPKESYGQLYSFLYSSTKLPELIAYALLLKQAQEICYSCPIPVVEPTSQLTPEPDKFQFCFAFNTNNSFARESLSRSRTMMRAYSTLRVRSLEQKNKILIVCLKRAFLLCYIAHHLFPWISNAQ